MLEEMTPDMLTERMAYELVCNESHEQPNAAPNTLTPDTPDFDRKLLGMIHGATR